jgi:hypothetical protein
MRSLCQSIVIILILGTRALAGGSISFEENAVPLLRTEPELLRFVRQSLDVARVGDGVRLGRGFGDRQGSRVTPFTFEARPKGTNGPFTLLLIINSPDGMNNNQLNRVSIEIRPIRLPTPRHQ